MAEKIKVYPYVVGEEQRQAQQRRGLDPVRIDEAAKLFTDLRSTLERAGVSSKGLTVRLSLANPSTPSEATIRR